MATTSDRLTVTTSVRQTWRVSSKSTSVILLKNKWKKLENSACKFLNRADLKNFERILLIIILLIFKMYPLIVAKQLFSVKINAYSTTLYSLSYTIVGLAWSNLQLSKCLLAIPTRWSSFAPVNLSPWLHSSWVIIFLRAVETFSWRIGPASTHLSVQLYVERADHLILHQRGRTTLLSSSQPIPKQSTDISELICSGSRRIQEWEGVFK